MAKRTCFFCNQEKPLTREHIYPNWLFDFISTTDEKFSPGIHPIELSLSNERADNLLENNLSDGRSIPFDNFVYKTVCAEYNNGWMAKLEGEVREILKDSLLNSDIKVLIKPNEAYKLSLWAIKTLLLIAKTTNYFEFDIRIPQMIKNGIVPEGFMVEFSSLEFSDLNYYIGGPMVKKTFRIPREYLDDLYNNILIMGLQIGYFVFRVSYLRTEQPLYRMQIKNRVNILYPYGSVLPFEEIDPPQIEIDKKIALALFCAELSIVD